MPHSTPSISIIVPVFNVETYIEQCLTSLVNQHLKEVEIIIIIDGSTDSSENIAKIFAENHTNITIVNTPNRGLGAARNEGIKYAKGEYLAFVDSDDYIDAGMYQDMLDLANEHQADIVACNFFFAYEDGPEVVQPDMRPKLITDPDEAIRDVLMSQNMNNCAWNKLYKRTLFDTNIRFTEGRYYEDLYPVLQWIKASNRIYLTSTPYYYYRRARTGAITARFSEKHINDYIFLINNVKNWLSENHLSEKFKTEFATCAFKIYKQLMFNVFFIKNPTPYSYYKTIVNNFLPDKYFTYNTVIPDEKNKSILISVLNKTNKGKIGKKLSFYLMSLMCFIMKKVRRN